MLSRKEAEAASQALLQAGHHERDEGSPLLARFPELRALPYAERKPVLERARRRVWGHWSILLATVTFLALAIAWLVAVILQRDLAESIWWTPFAAGLLLQQLLRYRLRRELRRLVN